MQQFNPMSVLQVNIKSFPILHFRVSLLISLEGILWFEFRYWTVSLSHKEYFEFGSLALTTSCISPSINCRDLNSKILIRLSYLALVKSCRLI